MLVRQSKSSNSLTAKEDDVSLADIALPYAKLVHFIISQTRVQKWTKIGLRLTSIVAADDPVSEIVNRDRLGPKLTKQKIDEVISSAKIDDIHKAYISAISPYFSEDEIMETKEKWPLMLTQVIESLKQGNGVIDGVGALMSRIEEKGGDASHDVSPATLINGFRAVFVLLTKTPQSEQILIDQLNYATKEELFQAYKEDSDGSVTFSQYTAGYLLGVPVWSQSDVKLIRPALASSISRILEYYV